MGGEIPSIPLCLYGMHVETFIYLFIVFQNPYAGVRAMDIGTVKE
jgi:hypothetical protein